MDHAEDVVPHARMPGSGLADFFATKDHKEKPSKRYIFFALFVILCGYTNLKTF
jgi:hypothetical protein